jgi:hypothetical protein
MTNAIELAISVTRKRRRRSARNCRKENAKKHYSDLSINNYKNTIDEELHRLMQTKKTR